MKFLKKYKIFESPNNIYDTEGNLIAECFEDYSYTFLWFNEKLYISDDDDYVVAHITLTPHLNKD